jgi:hypothetical protein
LQIQRYPSPPPEPKSKRLSKEEQEKKPTSNSMKNNGYSFDIPWRLELA